MLNNIVYFAGDVIVKCNTEKKVFFSDFWS